MKWILRLGALALFALLVLQLARPKIGFRSTTAPPAYPAQVQAILEKDCYSCHSDENHLRWFDQPVPAYWLVRYDILAARQHLNFSMLGEKPVAAQRATLYEAVNMIQLGAMPPGRFLLAHPEARVSAADLATMKDWLQPWATHADAGGQEPGPGLVAGEAAPVGSDAVKPEPNGLRFYPDYTGWRLISATDRGDNGTLRLILGNNVAMRAAAAGETSPWPDGTRFAKIAWQQSSGADGLLAAGKFVQVEFMEKHAGRFRDTDGWGWSRWRGANLTPYGKDAAFVGECTSCHAPVKGNDSVYTLPISNAATSREEVLNTRAAALPASLPYQPLQWNPVSVFANRRQNTISILFANDAAMAAHKAGGAATGDAVLALVTWKERDDPHWFGARIPDAPAQVEFVASGKYRLFSGDGLREATPSVSDAEARTAFVKGIPFLLP
ncbi:cytochrome P460 family protein [Silvibacterium dinghuense]|uniref:Haem-binding domain-containing protein n=1 Tax=Silvibacterium dinghuense TaxID=1560006 RepID=A0A4Q1SJ47_9BACT|nr:cytochrome P460 family protein [Silvibacterium dinghuense]RXS97646.1 hypothetical protein ESZ00_07145 [Silvibacterium dinghuense]GGH00801.1 hypothetical protein GCM10011586_15510 [Silvibacterium dinghuense]